MNEEEEYEEGEEGLRDTKRHQETLGSHPSLPETQFYWVPGEAPISL